MGSKKNNLRVVRDAEDHSPYRGTSKGALRRIMKNQRRNRVYISSNKCMYETIINFSNLFNQTKEDNNA